MDKPEMLHDMKDDFYIWYNTKDPIFSEISLNSRLPQKWVEFDPIRSSKYSDSILKPINAYVEALYPPPTLVSIDGNTVRLRQGNHAEFFLLQKSDGFFKHIDRPWMRQYYNTEFSPEIPDECFKQTFKFYSPWYLDEDVDITYEQPNVDSPFFVYEIKTTHKKINLEKYVEPDFIPFHFKKIGSHMVDDNFGKIKRQSPMFDIVFQGNDIIVERVRKFYEHH